MEYKGIQRLIPILEELRDGLIEVNKTKYVFKYVAVVVHGNNTIELRSYQILSETKCGYWVDLDLDVKKWVRKSGKNLWAFTTEREALFNFLIKKEKHIYHAQMKLNVAKDLLEAAKRKLNPMTKSEQAQHQNYRKALYRVFKNFDYPM